jgi:signal transduction histidine kinase
MHGLAATLGDPNALAHLAEILGRQLGADACLVLGHHQGTQTITHTSWYGDTPPRVRMLADGSQPPEIDLQRQVALALIRQSTTPTTESRPIPLTHGVSALLRQDNQSLDWLTTIKTYRAIAVQSVPDTQACVLLFSRRPQFNLDLDHPTQTHVASVVAIALHQHQLQYQAQRSAEQLLYLNYLKEDFLSTLNHELRTPLTSMMLAIRMLRRPDLTPDRATMYLDILEQQCSRESNLVNDLLMLQTLDTKPPQTAFAPLNLTELITDLGTQVQPHLATAHLTLDLQLPSQPITVTTAASPLSRVLQELLTNARKYSAPQTTITLTLTVTATAATVQLTNLGAAIQPEEIPYIFDKFRRGQNATQDAIPGTGTGLALVQGLVQQLGGTIQVSSQPTQDGLWQTSFTLAMPM